MNLSDLLEQSDLLVGFIEYCSLHNQDTFLAQYINISTCFLQHCIQPDWLLVYNTAVKAQKFVDEHFEDKLIEEDGILNNLKKNLASTMALIKFNSDSFSELFVSDNLLLLESLLPLLHTIHSSLETTLQPTLTRFQQQTEHIYFPLPSGHTLSSFLPIDDSLAELLDYIPGKLAFKSFVKYLKPFDYQLMVDFYVAVNSYQKACEVMSRWYIQQHFPLFREMLLERFFSMTKTRIRTKIAVDHSSGIQEFLQIQSQVYRQLLKVYPKFKTSTQFQEYKQELLIQQLESKYTPHQISQDLFKLQCQDFDSKMSEKVLNEIEANSPKASQTVSAIFDRLPDSWNSSSTEFVYSEADSL